MPKLAYRSPLAGVVDPLGIVGLTGRGIRVVEKPHPAMIELRGDPADDAFSTAAAKALGFALPAVAGTVNEGNGWRALWSRPDAWLVVGPASDGAAMLPTLKDTLRDIIHAATDVAHRAVVLEVEGNNARLAFSKGSPFDFHPSVFHAGRCARTIMAGQPVLLHATGDMTYDLYIDQSAARAFWQWLREAAREYTA